MKYFYDYTINYNIKNNLDASPVQMMFILQEVALRHGIVGGFDMSWFAENNRGWLLTSWQVEFTRAPKWGERIRVHTWPTQFKGIVGERAFSAVSLDNGDELLCANSIWIYTDIIRKRPLKPPESMVLAYGASLPPAIEKDFDIPDFSGFPHISTREYTALRSDGDTNFHVNNVKYIEWATNDLMDGVYSKNLKVLKASYKKPCVVGEAITTDLFCEENGKDAECVSRIAGKDGETAALVYTKWSD